MSDRSLKRRRRFGGRAGGGVSQSSPLLVTRTLIIGASTDARTGFTRTAPILPAHATSTPHTPHPYPHVNAHSTTPLNTLACARAHTHTPHILHTHLTHTSYTHTEHTHRTHTPNTHHLQAMKKMKTKMIIEGDLTKLRYGRRHERRGIRIRRKHDQNVNRAEKRRLRRVLRRINVIRNREC